MTEDTAQAWIADTDTLRKLNRRAVERDTEAMSERGELVLREDGRHVGLIASLSVPAWRAAQEASGRIPDDAECWTTWVIEVDDPEEEREHAVAHVILLVREVTALEETRVSRGDADRLVEFARERIAQHHDAARFADEAQAEIERLIRGEQ